jgi:DNA-binding transcriptional LysR family regulator
MLKRIDWEARIGRRLRLRDLHAFFTVVQCGSMAQAAGQLGVSQPAISKVIADLEHALGVRLLDRSRRGVEPTIYGHALLKRGLVAFDELKQGIRDIEFLADPTAGELTIGCADSIAATLLPPVLERFSAKYPRVALRVDTVPSPAINDPGLRDRKYDLVLGRRPMPLANLADDLQVEFLLDDRLVVAAGMHTPWARRRKIDLAELVGERWMLPPPGNWTYACVAAVFRARALDMPRVSLMTFSLPLIIHFLANGPHIAVFPNSVMHLHETRYSLKALPVDVAFPPWPVAIVTLRNRTLSPVVERFIECAREVTKSIAARPPAAHGKRARPGAEQMRVTPA